MLLSTIGSSRGPEHENLLRAMLPFRSILVKERVGYVGVYWPALLPGSNTFSLKACDGKQL